MFFLTLSLMGWITLGPFLSKYKLQYWKHVSNLEEEAELVEPEYNMFYNPEEGFKYIESDLAGDGETPFPDVILLIKYT